MTPWLIAPSSSVVLCWFLAAAASFKKIFHKFTTRFKCLNINVNLQEIWLLASHKSLSYL